MIQIASCVLAFRATSHLNVRLIAMPVTVDKVSANLYEILNTNYSQNISADRRDATASLDAACG